MDYGAHTPYILAAYSVSIIAVLAMIYLRLRDFMKAKNAEQEAAKNPSPKN